MVRAPPRNQMRGTQSVLHSMSLTQSREETRFKTLGDITRWQRTRTTATLGYFQIIGKCEETDDSSYTRTTADGKEETVSKVQLSLVIPGMQDRVRVELPLEVAPSTDLLSQWELEESWLVVSATGMRALAFKRSNARAGEKEVGSFVVFAGTTAREATADERKQLQAARKAQKTQAKQRRATARRREGRRRKQREQRRQQATAQQSA